MIEDLPVIAASINKGSSRRQFLGQLSAALLASRMLGQGAHPDARIKRIPLSTLQGRFQKFVAMNANDTKPKGTTYEHTLIRIETDTGVEGLAPGSYADLCTPAYARALQPLIGAKISEIYTLSDGLVSGRGDRFASLLMANRHLDCAFFDILGKLTGRPLWMLIGNEGTKEVPVYDSTVYFSDVWFRDRGVAAIRDECKEAIHAGYRGVKIKLGRGDKWMPREEGDRRDIEVALAAREAIGPASLLMADANYGYRGQYDKAMRLMDETKTAGLLWMEEIFPETPEMYARFRNDLKAQSDPCKIAFGEHMHAVDTVDPYLRPSRVIDYVQYDIRANGFIDNIAVARKCAAAGATVDNHNWASQMGFIMSLHLARAVGNYGILECDRSTCDVLRVDTPSPVKGTVPAPSNPGLGISIDEDVYRAKHAAGEIIVS
jgi:L-alanine-DL-glutamate epimerase-like enolase superfamily enzyme